MYFKRKKERGNSNGLIAGIPVPVKSRYYRGNLNGSGESDFLVYQYRKRKNEINRIMEYLMILRGKGKDEGDHSNSK